MEAAGPALGAAAPEAQVWVEAALCLCPPCPFKAQAWNLRQQGARRPPKDGRVATRAGSPPNGRHHGPAALPELQGHRGRVAGAPPGWACGGGPSGLGLWPHRGGLMLSHRGASACGRGGPAVPTGPPAHCPHAR